eukprot:2103736-Prymnesium_polylepis.1
MAGSQFDLRPRLLGLPGDADVAGSLFDQRELPTAPRTTTPQPTPPAFTHTTTRALVARPRVWLR